MLAGITAQASRDVQADRDLAIIEERLNGLLRVVEKTSLKLFSISRGRRQLIEPNTAVPVHGPCRRGNRATRVVAVPCRLWRRRCGDRFRRVGTNEKVMESAASRTSTRTNDPFARLSAADHH